MDPHNRQRRAETLAALARLVRLTGEVAGRLSAGKPGPIFLARPGSDLNRLGRRFEGDAVGREIRFFNEVLPSADKDPG